MQPLLNRFLRSLILGASENATVRRFVRRYGMRLGAARFVAGETIDDCVRVLRQLNDRGLRANTTLLGEGVAARDATAALVSEYEAILDRIHTERLQCNIAVKLTQLGLVLDEELAFLNLARLVDHAAALGNSVRIDMEQSEHVDATLRIYRRLRESGRDAVGLVEHLHGKEGVDGSSPSEGSKVPANPLVLLSDLVQRSTSLTRRESAERHPTPGAAEPLEQVADGASTSGEAD